MIDVYVRDIEDISGNFLGEFSLNDIEKLVTLFEKFDTVNKQEDACSMVATCFVLLDNMIAADEKAIFEIVVGKVS